jgi:Ankyrin repeats (3 copies)/Ankyrin repeat
LKDFLLAAKLPESVLECELCIKLASSQEGALHALAASRCLQYLCLYTFQDKNLFRRKGDSCEEFIYLSKFNALLDDDAFNSLETRVPDSDSQEMIEGGYFDYASCHWAYHLSRADEVYASKLVDGAVAISKVGSTVLWNWSESYRRVYGRVHETWEFPDFEVLDPFLVAATFDHPETIRKILTGSTPMPHESLISGCIWAARWGSLRCIEEIFKGRADELAQAALGECLYDALQHNQPEICKFLLKEVPEGQISFSKSEGALHRTALTTAIEMGSYDLVELIYPRIIAKHRNRDDRILTSAIPGKYCLHTDDGPARRQRNMIFEFLLEKAVMEQDVYPLLLFVAARSGCLFSVTYLLDQEHGEVRELALKKEYSEGGLTALQQAVQFGHRDVVDHLCQQPEMRSQLERTYAEGENLIHIAAKLGRETTLRTLLQHYPHGAGALDDDGRSPLSLAAFSGNPQVVRSLLQTGRAEVDTPSRGRTYTPLMYAVAGGKLQMCEILIIEGGADWSKVVGFAENGEMRLKIPLIEWSHEQTLSALSRYIKAAEGCCRG